MGLGILDILVHFGILSIYRGIEHVLGTSCQQPCWDCSGGCWYPLPLAVEAGSSLALCSLCLPMPPNYVKPSESVANRPPKPTQTALKIPRSTFNSPKTALHIERLTPRSIYVILTPKHTNNIKTKAISCVLHGFHQVCPDFNLCPSCEQNCIDETFSKLKLKQLQNSKAVYWQPSLGIQANSALSC